MDNLRTRYEIPQRDESGIELSHIAGHVYDSLHDSDRDSHDYVNTTDTDTTTDYVTNNVKSERQPNDTAKNVSFHKLKVEIPCWAICLGVIGVLLFCTLICAISGSIVYHVINTKIEMHTSQNHAIEPRTDISDMIQRLEKIQEKQNALDNIVQTVSQKQNTSGQQVAFTVHTATEYFVDEHILTFKNVILNVGDGYNQTNGRFTCPVAGTYLFTATLVSIYHRSGATWCLVRKNAISVGLLLSQDGHHDAVSVSVIFHLSVGDFVDIGRCYKTQYISKADKHGTFIGSLIQAD